MSSRNSTNPSPYDQLVVLSQILINEAFHNMYLLADDDDPIKKFHHGKQTDQRDHVNVQLAAPTIQLQATKNFPQLYFIMNMISGTLHLDVSNEDDDDAIWKDYDTTDWVFAFPVSIAQKIIPKSDPRFIRAVTDTGLDPSIFSLAQLYVDTSTSSKYEPSLSTFGTTDWSKEPPEARANLDNFISKWLKLMQEKDQSVLGYTIQHTEDPDNPDKTTFPPTSVDYYVYPWKGENGYSAVADNLPNNALCYLMMSGFRPPPAPVGLPYTGPYVNGGGTYCLSKSIFWDQWLFPALGRFGTGVTALCDVPTATSAGSSDWPWSISCGYSIESPSLMGLGAFEFTPYPHKNNAWYLKVGAGFSKAYDPNTDSPDLYSSCDTNIDVSFQPGGQTIDINGLSQFTIYTNFDRSTYNYKNISKINVSIAWSFQLGLSGVSDGGLEVSLINVEEPHPTESTVYPGDVIYELGEDGVGSAFANKILDFMEFSITDLKEVLTDSIQNQHKLFLPGSGSYLMKNPVFNDRGDLLVGLEYQGADPPVPPEHNQSVQTRRPAKDKSGISKAAGQARTVHFTTNVRRN